MYFTAVVKVHEYRDADGLAGYLIAVLRVRQGTTLPALRIFHRLAIPSGEKAYRPLSLFMTTSAPTRLYLGRYGPIHFTGDCQCF